MLRRDVTRKVRWMAVLAVSLTTGFMMSMAATSVSAAGTLPFTNWAVWGELTPKKLNEPVVLPKGATFNGAAEVIKLSNTEVDANVSGNLFVPPFKAKVKLVGLVPTEVGVTFTQVGEPQGTLTNAPPADCVGAKFAGICAELKVNAKADIGITAAGFEGIEIPTECQTAEPVSLSLSTTGTVGELFEAGAHFTGTTTIPSISCTGLSGALLGPVLTTVMSGPENPYSLHFGPIEPSAPVATTKAATSVSQITARLNATVNPTGEPLTGCVFEYGTSPTYGTSVPCESRPGADFGETSLLQNVSENTTYHYRVVATNVLGTTDGADQSFTTLGRTGEPEYGHCVAQKAGAYADSNCNTKPAKAGKGKFEWQPGPGPTCVAKKKGEYTDSTCTTKSAKPKKGTFEKAGGSGYTFTSGTVTLESLGLGRTVVCAASTDAGEVTAATTGVDRITLTGCEAAGKKCTSEGPNSTPSGKTGVIISNLLDTRLLGPVSIQSLSSQVWTEFASSEHEPYSAEFGCEGTLFRTKGTLAGVQEGDVNSPSLTGTTTFSFEQGEVGQELEGDEGVLTEVSENGRSSWSGPDASTVVTTANDTFASAVEIKP